MYDYNYVDFEFDSNGDGYADSYLVAYDTTGDGNFDQVLMISDTNGDGVEDTLAMCYDTDKNGQLDTFQLDQDTNGDGMYDMVYKAYDYNQDGEIDSLTTYVDADHDGQYEHVAKAHDSTGDGVLEHVDYYMDSDGTGTPDYHQAFIYDPTVGQLVPTMAAGFEVGGTYSFELENFQPDFNYPADISGDPAESMTYWECQGNTNRCALFSQKFVIEELSPNIDHIDIEDFADIAKEQGWFSEDEGTTMLNMNNMLDYYGIDNEMSFHNTIDDLEDCLNNGGKVIVAIDANEIWYGEDNNIFSPESGANHAVEVIGIDRTDPNNPMVILNDSGSPSGKGEMIPLDVFEGAWEDGNCQMIECYPSES